MSDDIVSKYLAAADVLASARVRFAQEFARMRPRMGSDQQAIQAAIEITRDEITVRQAELKVLEAKLNA